MGKKKPSVEQAGSSSSSTFRTRPSSASGRKVAKSHLIGYVHAIYFVCVQQQNCQVAIAAAAAAAEDEEAEELAGDSATAVVMDGNRSQVTAVASDNGVRVTMVSTLSRVQRTRSRGATLAKEEEEKLASSSVDIGQ